MPWSKKNTLIYTWVFLPCTSYHFLRFTDEIYLLLQLLIYANIINTLVGKYALGHCPGQKKYPDIHKSLSTIYIIPFFKIYWWNILLQLLIYSNMIKNPGLKICPSALSLSKNKPWYRQKSFCLAYHILFYELQMKYTIAITNIINTLVRKYALGHCSDPKIYPSIHTSPCAIHIIPFFTIFWWNILLLLLIYPNTI